MNRVFILLAAAALAGGCKPPLHLSYDYGRAFVETLRVQADLTRPSVQYAGYSLYGPEAARIRLNAEEASSAKEEAVGELTAEKGQ
jgi:hypothetical protein